MNSPTKKSINLKSLGCLIFCGLIFFGQTACFIRPRTEPILDPRPDEKPIKFEYFEMSSDDSSNNSASTVLVVEGELENFANDLKFVEEKRIGDKIISEKNWEGEVDNRLRDAILETAANTELEKNQGASLPTNGRIIKLTLIYGGARMRKGSPVNQQDWQNIVQTVRLLSEKDDANDNSANKKFAGGKTEKLNE